MNRDEETERLKQYLDTIDMKMLKHIYFAGLIAAVLIILLSIGIATYLA